MVIHRSILLFICLLFCCLQASFLNAQFYNKEIVARISVEKNSEFYTFKATAENKTPTDYGLRYVYSIFITENNGDISKSEQENRFFINGNDKKVLNKLTVNYNLEKKTIILLIIYDNNDKPIAKDRIELENGGRSDFEIEEDRLPASNDQASSQDGYLKRGFIKQKLITKSGKDFFRYFYSDFYNRDIVTDKNILIEETFGRGRSTRIIVKVEDQTVMQFFAQPRKEFLVNMATIALGRSLRQIQRLEQQKEQLIRY